MVRSTDFTEIRIYRTVYPNTTVWLRNMEDVNKQEIKITGAEMRYLRKCKGKTRRDRIINSLIIKILIQDLVTKMVDKRELKWFGHLIGLDSNRRPRRVWEKS